LKQRSRKPAAVGKPVRVAPDASVVGICLVGFMGAGKSTVGLTLSERLHWDFEDLDVRIEEREGQSIAQIFQDSGEAAFRRVESAALVEILAAMRGAGPRVLALGGGAFVRKQNAAALEKAGLPVIFLDAPVEELWRRCCLRAAEFGRERPLQRNSDEFRKLYGSRRSSYLRATQIIDTTGRTIEAIAAEIAEMIGDSPR
jgi:shikimate kinase